MRVEERYMSCYINNCVGKEGCDTRQGGKYVNVLLFYSSGQQNTESCDFGSG